jgi:hypothetical protein
MNFLKKLIGRFERKISRFERKAPQDNQWNSRPPAQRPASRRRVQAAQAIAPDSEEEKNPFLDADFGDMELINDEAADVDDPYTSATWKVEQENNERTLKATGMPPKRRNEKTVDSNPYDTGIFKARKWRG